MNKKGYLEDSFNWLFAIVVGIFVLALAIFIATKLTHTEQTTQDAKIGNEINILLNPLETSFESGTTSSFTLPVDTRIYAKCHSDEPFGKQIIQISQKSFDRWSMTNISVGFSNKYIFTEKYVEGKNFYLFAKPFESPFKVADLIIMTSSLNSYCFESAPEDIKKELTLLNQKNIFTENCPENSYDICFSGGSNCYAKVDMSSQFVQKNYTKMFFSEEALMYSAIFSSPEIYECQLNRLMLRINQLALIYKDKASFISRVNCNSNLNQDLISLINAANSFSDSQDIYIIESISEEINNKNDFSGCKLW